MIVLILLQKLLSSIFQLLLMNPFIIFRTVAKPSRKILLRIASASVLEQGLYFKVFFTFYLDWLWWIYR